MIQVFQNLLTEPDATARSSIAYFITMIVMMLVANTHSIYCTPGTVLNTLSGLVY